MLRTLRILLKSLAYAAATVVILLAVAVGLFRLLLPRLPEYQDQIKEWAGNAIGMQVEFSDMDARWRLSGPELNFYDAELVTPASGTPLLYVDEVSVGVGLLRLIMDRELVVDRVLVRGSEVNATYTADREWLVQGIALEELTGRRGGSGGPRGPMTVVGEDLRVDVRHEGLQQRYLIGIGDVTYRRDAMQQGFDGTLALPPSLGNQLEVAASQRLGGEQDLRPWQFFVEGQSLDAAGLSRLWPDGPGGFASGNVDLSLWLDLGTEGVQRASANFVMTDVVAGREPTTEPFASRGRLEYSREEDGWLVAASEFVLITADSSWPQSTLQLRVTEDPTGDIAVAEGNASYIDLDDVRYLAAWIPEDFRRRLEELALSGVLRDLQFSVNNVEASPRRYDVAATMERVGIAANGEWPGVSGFSGAIRADQSGGRLELAAENMLLDLQGHLPQPVNLLQAEGTLIWRRGSEGTTLLSDSIRMRNDDLDSVSSLQLTLPPGDTSPTIDLQSSWSFDDISAVERYLPLNVLKPALRRWLSDALVAGTIPDGSLRLSGPLAKFPFDEGEGVFRIDARVENAVLRYSSLWPATENMNLDMVVDGARLYSFRNEARSVGNNVVDAKVEIADLRKPVLTIDASADGTLETIRNFSRRSPISTLFGGHLDRIDVDGEASFDLSVRYPILDRRNYEFTTSILTDDGTLRVDGLPAPVTGLSGKITITRDDVSSESLSGSFLGQPIDIELLRDDVAAPGYSVVASVDGRVNERGLVEGLGAPLEGLIEGNAAYRAELRFPRPGQEEPRAFQVAIDSTLRGMRIALPEPVTKPPDAVRQLALTIEFPEEGRITAAGEYDEQIRFSAGFLRGDQGWDFDRGIVSAGGADAVAPPTRGLHVMGETPVLDVDEWLNLPRPDGEGPGFGERVRSIDLIAEELRVLGQQYGRHRLQVDRSALDWVIGIDGDQAAGSVTVPYDLAGERPLALEMQRLVLPGGGGTAADSEDRRDPRELPPLEIVVEDFALGQRRLGRFVANFEKTESGLETERFTAESDSFMIVGSAGWVADATDPGRQRSYVTGRLNSTDVGRTMEQLDYQPGIESERMDVEFDVSFAGGPREDFVESLNGEVTVRFGSGQLDEVEPGAGRVFGLMSIVALPRRLSLDFRDVFERGFGFDELTGTFRLVDGDAYTCDLSLKGPAADVGIVGRAGLAAKDYNQTAVVSANVGNTLPVVGAVVAGPQVAAALLIFSQIFKKPLQEMGQAYYAIDGSWEDPVIDGTGAERFAATSQLAGCIQDTE